MVSENRLLRKIFGLKGDCVRGEWRKLHKEKLRDLYCSSNKIREIKSKRMKLPWNVARNVARMVHRRDACRVKKAKSKGKRPLGKLRSRWEGQY